MMRRSNLAPSKVMRLLSLSPVLLLSVNMGVRQRAASALLAMLQEIAAEIMILASLTLDTGDRIVDLVKSVSNAAALLNLRCVFWWGVALGSADCAWGVAAVASLVVV